MKKSIVTLFIMCAFLMSCAKTESESSHNDTNQITSENDMNNTNKEEEIKSSELHLKWYFYQYYDNRDEFENPMTDVYLLVEAGSLDEKIKLGTYLGHTSSYTIDQMADIDIPENTVMAAFTYYAGFGDTLCVVKDQNQIRILSQPIEEHSEDVDSIIYEFLEIASIDVTATNELIISSTIIEEGEMPVDEE